MGIGIGSSVPVSLCAVDDLCLLLFSKQNERKLGVLGRQVRFASALPALVFSKRFYIDLILSLIIIGQRYRHSYLIDALNRGLQSHNGDFVS